MPSENELLKVRNLSTQFFLYEGTLKVLDGISFDVTKNEVFGLVGESGSGKTVTALSILRVIEEPGRVVSGEAIFRGRDLFKLSEKEMKKVRGNEISMIFQQAKTALNPFLKIGKQISRIYEIHEKISSKEARKKTIEILKKVGISDSEKRVDDYPHQLSGGQAQRVMIALMSICRPYLLIADEPTTGLDVNTQAQILELMVEQSRKTGSSIMLITHDLGIVAQTCDRVAVMHAGHIVEIADVESLFLNPQHPYTIGLMESIPHIDKREKITGIPGTVPKLINPPIGCRFSNRCLDRMVVCEKEEIEKIEVEPRHYVFCHKYSPT